MRDRLCCPEEEGRKENMRKISRKAISAAVMKWTGRWFGEDNQRAVWCLFYVCYCALMLVLGFLLFMIFLDFMEDISQ